MKGVAVTQTQKANQQQDRHGPPVLQIYQIQGISLNPESFKAIISNLITLFSRTGSQCTAGVELTF
jgi:hypothetical protein